MKIGMVSAYKHCKTHITALREDGYDVTCLGASPTSIPPTYEALVVRVASSSHGGTDVARAWGRETGLPLIYEDGLSGIRRELRRLAKASNGMVVTRADEASPPVRVRSVYDVLRGEACRFLATEGVDHSELENHLRSFADRKWGNAHRAVLESASNMIKAITAELAAPVASNNEDLNMDFHMMITEADRHRGPLPKNASWTKVHKPGKGDRFAKMVTDLVHRSPQAALGLGEVFAVYEDCCRMGASARDPFRVSFKRVVEHHNATKVFYTGGDKTVFTGNPVLFTMFAMCVSNLHRMNGNQRNEYVPYKGAFTSAYESLTGKTLDTSVPDWVAWYLNLPRPSVSPTTPANKVSTTPANKDPVASVGQNDMLAKDVEDNTRAILDLMDTVRNLEQQVAGLAGTLATIKEADRVQPAVISNPLDSLNEIKARLSDMGFKGTLTLNID